MASPTDSTGPTTPTASSPITGASALWTWFKAIGDWIKSLSPSGATKYDTGWVALSTVAAATGGTCVIRRYGKIVQLQINGVTVPIAATGTTTLVDTIPTEYLPTNRTVRGTAVLTPGSTSGTLASTGGGGLAVFNNSVDAKTAVNAGTLIWIVD